MLKKNINKDNFITSRVIKEKKKKKKLRQPYPFQCPKFLKVQSCIHDTHIRGRTLDPHNLVD